MKANDAHSSLADRVAGISDCVAGISDCWERSHLYIIGPNDVLAVTVFNQPQLSGKFAVGSDGTLAFPLLGRVMVGGLTVGAVEDEMRRRLAAGYVKDPRINVTIEQSRSQLIFIIGEVRQPGALPLTGSMTLIEALARAGSTTERAGMEAMIVRPRSADPGWQQPCRLAAMLERRDYPCRSEEPADRSALAKYRASAG